MSSRRRDPPARRRPSAPGMTTEEINRIVHEDTLQRGGRPRRSTTTASRRACAPRSTRSSATASPTSQRIEDGDIINVDVTTHLRRLPRRHLGHVLHRHSPRPRRGTSTEVARKSLELGIAEVREGARLGDIGAAIQEFAEGQGCSRGARVRRSRHRPPASTSRRRCRTSASAARALRLKAGMMLHHRADDQHRRLRGRHPRRRAGRCITRDGSLSAQFEHTLVVTKEGCEILTARNRPLVGSEVFSPPGPARNDVHPGA